MMNKIKHKLLIEFVSVNLSFFFYFQVDPSQRHIDEWVIVHWILPQCVPEFEKWERIAHGRLFGAIAHGLTRKNRQAEFCETTTFLQSLKRCQCESMPRWASEFSEGTNLLLAAQGHRALHVTRRAYSSMDMLHYRHETTHLFSLVQTGTFHWAQFLTQSRVKTYVDIVEGVGVRLCTTARVYEGGETVWPLIGRVFKVARDIVMASMTQCSSERWSFFERAEIPMYLGGPISLINHACRKHCNVVIKAIEKQSENADTQRWVNETVVAVAEMRIEPNDRIYVCYDDCADGLFASRKIFCLMCMS